MGAPEACPQPVTNTGIINSAAYANGVRVGDVAIDQAGDVLRQSDRFVWIGLFEPSEELLQRSGLRIWPARQQLR